MEDKTEIEIVGFSDSECGPFPCDDTRSCGLEQCAPTNRLLMAFDALADKLKEKYGSRILLKLTLIDDDLPDHIRVIYEREHPPFPMILVNGKLTPIGRISYPLIVDEIEKLDQ